MQDSADTPPDLVDLEIAGQLLSPSSSAEEGELRSMLREMLRDVSRRLDALRDAAETATADAARHELHQLRGNVASFGLARCASHLSRLEDDWPSLTADARIRLLTAGIEDLHGGATELVGAHPWLA